LAAVGRGEVSCDYHICTAYTDIYVVQLLDGRSDTHPGGSTPGWAHPG
jgi:hypothetical protein